MFCTICLKKSNELKPMQQLHKDAFEKLGNPIALNSKDQWICLMCEEDNKMRQGNLIMEKESNQLIIFLEDLKEIISCSPTESSNKLLMQNEVSTSPTKCIDVHEEEIKIEKVEIDYPEEFILDDVNNVSSREGFGLEMEVQDSQTEEFILDDVNTTNSGQEQNKGLEMDSAKVQKSPPANSRLICKKVYTIIDDSVIADVCDIQEYDVANSSLETVEKYDDQPLNTLTFGAIFKGTSENGHVFDNYNNLTSAIIPSLTVNSNVDENALASSSMTIRKSKPKNMNAIVKRNPRASINRDSKNTSKMPTRATNINQSGKLSGEKKRNEKEEQNCLAKSRKNSKTAQSKINATTKGIVQQPKKPETFDNRYAPSKIRQSNRATTTKCVVQQPKKPETFDNSYGAFAKLFNRVNKHYYCNECGDSSAKYGTSNGVRNHIKLKHMGCRYICTECDNRFTSPNSLKMHYLRAHNITNGNILFEIPKGTNPHDTSLNFNNAMEKVDNSYHCLICTETPKYKYANEMYVRQHIRLYHYGYRYICTECDDAKYVDPRALKNHYSNVHNKKDGIIKFDIPKNKDDTDLKKYPHGYKKINGSYHCQLCTESEKKYASPTATVAHMKSVHFGFRYACVKCNNVEFVDKRGLKKHYEELHSGHLELKVKILNKNMYEDFMAKAIYPKAQPILNNEDYRPKDVGSSMVGSSLKKVDLKSIQRADNTNMAVSNSIQRLENCAQNDKTSTQL